MRLLHGLARTHPSFDDPDLVSHADLVPLMALKERAGLGDPVAEHVRPAGECAANAPAKVGCGRPASVRRLLAHGADPNLCDPRHDRTPLEECQPRNRYLDGPGHAKVAGNQ